MPMKSKAQRAYLWSQHPEVAREFEDATPKGAKLPGHVGDKKSKKEAGVLIGILRKRAADAIQPYIPPTNPDFASMDETPGEPVDPGFAEAMAHQQATADAADAAAAARVRADAGQGINANPGSALLPPAPVAPPVAPVARTPAPALPAPAIPIAPVTRPPQPGMQVKPKPPQPGQQLQKRPLQPGQIKRSALTLALKTAMVTIPGTLIGGALGAMSDADRSEDTTNKAVRGAATGAATGAGADVGGLLGAAAGLGIGGPDHRLAGGLIGAGIGATAGGILAHILARRKAKYKMPTAPVALKTAMEAPGPNKRAPSWAQPTPAVPPVAPVAPVTSSAPLVPGPNKMMPSTKQPAVKTGAMDLKPVPNKTNHPARYTATATSGKKLAAVLRARKSCG